MPCYAIEGVIPIIHPTAFVHPTAVLIGEVVVGANCYIGPNASVRGDFGLIEFKEGANLQDNCVVHCFPQQATIVEENGHIGHGAILHGCTIHRDVLIGMKAVIMDGAVIDERAIVAASALVPSNMHVPSRTLVAGLPAKVIRTLTDQEINWKDEGTRSYHLLTQRCLSTMVQVNPLTEREAHRPTLDVGDILQPLAQARAKDDGHA